MNHQVFMNIYNRLFQHYGPQYWWPGESSFEIMVGAVLTQNTNWKNVEKAIVNLKKGNYLTPLALYQIPPARLAERIKPAGYFNIKTRRLKCLMTWLFEKYDGKPENLQDIPLSVLREQLLAVKGIGPETADSICLYALEKPVFVVDAYTARIFGRHGLIEPGSGYEQIQECIQSALPRDARLFNEYHALLVRTGKDHCRPAPNCTGCPLEDLPHYIETELD